MAGRSDEAFLTDLLDAAPYIVGVIDEVGTITYINGRVEDIFGYTPDELVGRNMLDFLDADWNPMALDSIGYAMTQPGLRLPMLHRFFIKGGGGVVTETIANNQLDNPDVRGMVAFIRPWEEQILTDRIVESVAGGAPPIETFELLVALAGMRSFDAAAAILSAPSGGAFRNSVAPPGLPPALAGQGPYPSGVDVAALPWARTLAEGLPQSATLAELPPPVADRARSHGYERCFTWPIPVDGVDGVPGCLVAWRRQPEDLDHTPDLVAHRIVRLASLALGRHHTEGRLRHAALHDALTGLANRTRFFDDLERALAHDSPSPLVGVLYLDLDGFKDVNDAMGHGTGDDLLVTVADRLRDLVRPTDLVARIGGDEFAVLCADVADRRELEGIAARIVDALQLPVALPAGVARIGASVGIAAEPPGTIDGDGLLEAADRALYGVKTRGKGGWGVAG